MQLYALLAAIIVAAGGWAVAYLHGEQADTLEAEVKQLEQDKQTLIQAYENLSSERDRLDRIYTETRRESDRVQSTLEKQIEAIRNAEADDCADAPVSADRLEWLHRPVWEDTPGELPGDP